MKAIRRMSTTLREDEDYRNFRQATHVAISFFGIYTAVYSTQNLQSTIFNHAGYGSLGLISNAIAYLGQGIGSVYSVYYINKIGDIKAMAWGSVLSLPFIAALIFPTLGF
jgi:hypothetical protein